MTHRGYAKNPAEPLAAYYSLKLSKKDLESDAKFLNGLEDIYPYSDEGEEQAINNFTSLLKKDR